MTIKKILELNTEEKHIELNGWVKTKRGSKQVIFIALNDLKEAELSTRKAIELNPNFASPYINLGTIYSFTNKNNAAID